MTKSAKNSMSRRDFLSLLASSLFLFGFRSRKKDGTFRADIIRPPGVLNEEKFLSRCIRCGNCMKVCITNGLQPVMLQSGLEGVWTPQLLPEIGYCEYNCTLCGEVCPTGAIPKLELGEKRKAKLGTAKVNRTTCIAWAYNTDCMVCEEHCPVPEKAVKLVKDEVNGHVIYKPYVDKNLCVGCGICQNKCPAQPARAIKVHIT